MKTPLSIVWPKFNQMFNLNHDDVLIQKRAEPKLWAFSAVMEDGDSPTISVVLVNLAFKVEWLDRSFSQ